MTLLRQGASQGAALQQEASQGAALDLFDYVALHPLPEPKRISCARFFALEGARGSLAQVRFFRSHLEFLQSLPRRPAPDEVRGVRALIWRWQNTAASFRSDILTGAAA